MPFLGEFVPKEAVVDFDYVWTFQVKSWTDKDHDDVPEKFSALVLLYDKNFNLLLKSNIKIKKSKDPTAGNCLELLIDEWLKSIYTDIVEVSTDNEKQAE